MVNPFCFLLKKKNVETECFTKKNGHFKYKHYLFIESIDKKETKKHFDATVLMEK